MRSRLGPRPREVSHLVLDLFRARGRFPKPKAGTVPADLGEQGRALFLLGAGCSASAKIPLAAEVAQLAMPHLEKTYGLTPSATNTQALEQLVAAGHIPERYKPVARNPPPWSRLYGYLFSEHYKHPNEQRDLLNELLGADEPKLNWAHACLGALVQLRYVHTVLTTNFDQLALQGVIRTGIVPVVADGLESLARISPTPKRPQIVHLHGSMHTYELRNSFFALRETERDTGLQTMMMGILKEASVVVIIGYAGGEEGIMTLLQRAAVALPRMVLYWVAYQSDYAALSEGARRLLETGENKFFILGQNADDFFNGLVGELGVGAPGWIQDPLGVLVAQSKALVGGNSSEDVEGLIKSYVDRVSFASANGRQPDRLEDRVAVKRSALQFADAAEAIEKGEPGYRSRPSLLRLHARSLFAHYKRHSTSAGGFLERAIAELEEVVNTDPAAGPVDAALLIEALRSRIETLSDDDAARKGLLTQMKEYASTTQATIHRADNGFNWSLMEFFKAEADQLQAESLYRDGDLEAKEATRAERMPLHRLALLSYRDALPGLTGKDPIKARECKEGLAGALSGLAECEGKNNTSDAHVREARALFQEVVDSARVNTPEGEYAGALENLATTLQAIADHFPDERELARQEERRLLRLALEVYRDLEDDQGAARVRRRLD